MASDDEASVIYGLDHQARSMCGIVAEQDRAQFLVGTQTLKFENQVCLLDLDEDRNQISKNSFAHKEGEIWQLSSCPSDASQVATCYSQLDGCKIRPQCAVWSMNVREPSDTTNQSLVPVARLPVPEGSSHVSCFHWQPISDGNNPSRAMALCDGKVIVVDANFQGSQMQVVSQTQIESKAPMRLNNGKWNPHNNCNVIAAAVESSVQAWDIRSMSSAFTIENAHVPVVRDLDFNPNRQYLIATCGDDCKMRFWDTRKTDKSLMTVAQHSHWVWSVRFNPIHDQLLLSCSSDARLLLLSAASLSSEPNNDSDLDDSRETERMADGVVRTYEEHEESVYCCDWAPNDPWIFASLSYDGRLIIGRVPRKVKYQILQL
uniref:Protein TSSC1 n=1 Tax=Plectus sambesii TaxID=2011161 RepID=A0A914VC64_9BILA